MMYHGKNDFLEKLLFWIVMQFSSFNCNNNQVMQFLIRFRGMYWEKLVLKLEFLIDIPLLKRLHCKLSGQVLYVPCSLLKPCLEETEIILPKMLDRDWLFPVSFFLTIWIIHWKNLPMSFTDSGATLLNVFTSSSE